MWKTVLLAMTVFFSGIGFMNEEVNADVKVRNQIISNYSEVAPNTMSATVNGEYWEFELKSAVINNRKIQATYECRDPRGDLLYSLTLYFDKNISEGNYTSENGDLDFTVQNGALIARSEMATVYMGRKATGLKACGNFDLDITYRSDDWMTYRGVFSAELERDNSYGTSGDDYMSIEDAVFQFTITKP